MTVSTAEAPSEEKNSNLSPELQALVRTPEFKEWFGDWEGDPEGASKIVDENGEPALVYFGNASGIQKLHGNNRNRTGADELGFYFTSRKNNARFYASTLRGPVTDDVVPSSLYSAFLNMREPYHKQPGDGVRTERVTELPEGHDGYVNQVSQELVVFSPDQIHIVGEEIVNEAPRVPLTDVVSIQ